MSISLEFLLYCPVLLYLHGNLIGVFLQCIAARALYCWSRYGGGDRHRRCRHPHPLNNTRYRRRRRHLLEEIGWVASGTVDVGLLIDVATKSAIQMNSAFWGLQLVSYQEWRSGKSGAVVNA